MNLTQAIFLENKIGNNTALADVRVSLYDAEKEGVILVIKKDIVNGERAVQLKRIIQEHNLTLFESEGYLWLK